MKRATSVRGTRDDADEERAKEVVPIPHMTWAILQRSSYANGTARAFPNGNTPRKTIGNNRRNSSRNSYSNSISSMVHFNPASYEFTLVISFVNASMSLNTP